MSHRSLTEAGESNLGEARGITLHRAVGSALVDGGRPASHRRAEHLLAAGDVHGTVGAAFDAFWYMLHRDLPLAITWAKRLEGQLERRLGANAPATLILRLISAHGLAMGSDVDAADVILTEVLGQELPPDVEALGLYFYAHCHREDEDLDGSVAGLERALSIDHGTWMPVTLVRAELARQRGLKGEPERAVEALRELVQEQTDPVRRGDLARFLAFWLIRTGRDDEAQQWANCALEVEDQLGGSTRSAVYQLHGILAENREDWDAAEHWTRTSVEMREIMGLSSPAGCLNLAEPLAGRGAVEEAERWLVRAGNLPDRADPIEALTLLAIAAERGEWAVVAQHLVVVEAAMERRSWLPRSVSFALVAAEAVGPPELVTRLRALVEKIRGVRGPGSSTATGWRGPE